MAGHGGLHRRAAAAARGGDAVGRVLLLGALSPRRQSTCLERRDRTAQLGEGLEHVIELAGRQLGSAGAARLIRGTTGVVVADGDVRALAAHPAQPGLSGGGQGEGADR